MNILVTGGAGFIGSHLTDKLIEVGHEVVVIDDLSTGTKENLNPKATFYERSITDDLSDIFEKFKPEVVFHVAAQIDLRKSVESPVFDANTNILGSLNILENMKKFGSKKIIFSSTGGAIYGDGVKIPTGETEATEPCSPYGIAKLSIEKYLNFYKKTHGIDFTSLRYGNVYGPRQNPKGEAGVISIFVQKILDGEQPIINGSGKQTRDYVFVADVVNANLLSLEKNANGAFNVGTGKEIDVNTLFRKIVKYMDVDVEEVHGPEKPGEQLKSCLSYSKIENELGWKPEFDIDKGMKKTIEWFKSQAK